MYFAVEVSGPNNECWAFPPLGSRLRGRWNLHTTSPQVPGQPIQALHSAISASGRTFIPGQVLWLDVEKMRGGVYDLLGESDDGKRLMAAIAPVLREYEAIFGVGPQPQPSSEHDLDTDRVKTWLFLMRTAIDTGLAVLAEKSSELPNIREIREMPGRRIVDFAVSAGDGFAENADVAARRYADVVPESRNRGRERQTAGTGSESRPGGDKQGGQ
jgi:hypothetical protein